MRNRASWRSTPVTDSLGVCGSTDYIEHAFGLGEHGDVTALELMGGRFRGLRNKTFQLRCTVRSFLPTMYQLGFDFHAVPSIFWLKHEPSAQSP